MENQIVIGKIVAPHGVRGDIRILPLTDKPEQFLDLDYLLLPDGRKLTVKAARFHKRMVLVTTAEIKSMNESELLRGMEVSINAEDLPELEEGRFYVADLIGLPVYDEGRPEHRQQRCLCYRCPRSEGLPAAGTEEICQGNQSGRKAHCRGAA